MTFWKRFQQPHQFQKSSIPVILVASLVWVGSFQLRSEVIDLNCLNQPETCQLEDVFFLDRWLFKGESEEAHLLSFKTQNLAGALAIGVPVAMNTAFIFGGRVVPLVGLAQMAVDLVIIVEAMVLNGALNEMMKITTQRVRPHVYKHPTLAGDNPAHYTSFYSGHTSFTCVVSLSLFLVLMGRGVGTGWLTFFGLTGAGLTLSTGFLRVIAGRHFFTDVLFGMIFGIFFAIGIAKYRRRIPIK